MNVNNVITDIKMDLRLPNYPSTLSIRKMIRVGQDSIIRLTFVGHPDATSRTYGAMRGTFRVEALL